MLDTFYVPHYHVKHVKLSVVMARYKLYSDRVSLTNVGRVLANRLICHSYLNIASWDIGDKKYKNQPSQGLVIRYDESLSILKDSNLQLMIESEQ